MTWQTPGRRRASGTHAAPRTAPRAAILALQPTFPVAPSFAFPGYVPPTSVSEVYASSVLEPEQTPEQQSLSQVQTLPSIRLVSLVLL